MMTGERDIGGLGVGTGDGTTRFKIFMLWNLKIKKVH